MRTVVVVGLLAASLTSISASAQTYGLGVSAASADSVVLKIDGKDRTFTLGTGADTSAAEAFLTCLITDRVIKVERFGSPARLTMLDRSDVAGHVREFLQSKTSTDPCALGKAAYTPMRPAPAAAVESAVTKPQEAPAAPAPVSKKKLGRKTPPPESPHGDEKVLGRAFAGPAGAPAAAPAAPAAPVAGELGPTATTLATAPVERPSYAGQTAVPSTGPQPMAPSTGPQPVAPAPAPTPTAPPTVPPKTSTSP